MSQEDRILEILKTRKRVSNYEFDDIRPRIRQVPARIWGLVHKRGEPIIGYADPSDRKKYWYEYQQIAKDLFAA